MYSHFKYGKICDHYCAAAVRRSFASALAINRAAHCKKYFKVAFFVPVVMSLAVVSTLWMQIYSPEGILNTLLAHIGIE